MFNSASNILLMFNCKFHDPWCLIKEKARRFLKAVGWLFRQVYMYCSCKVVVFQLYSVNSSGEEEESIYGIMFEKFPATPKSDRKYFIMVSTLRYSNLSLTLFGEIVPSRIYHTYIKLLFYFQVERCLIQLL